MTFSHRRQSRTRRTSFLEVLEQRQLLTGNGIPTAIANARPAALSAQAAIVQQQVDAESSTDTGNIIDANVDEAPTATRRVAAALGSNQKTRLLVLTDIGGGDPDDEQSMVRLLAYANEFDIEGLVAGASTNGTNTTSEYLVQNIVNHYESVRPNLVRHDSGFPTASELRSKIVTGQRLNGTFGAGYDTPGSNLIIQAVDKSDSRPLNIAIWGGSTDLAQALWRVRQTRSTSEVNQFVSKIRVAWIEQNSSDAWIKSNFPNLWVVSNIANGNPLYQAPFRGMYLGGDRSLTTQQWVLNNVKAHQPFGNPYPPVAAGDAMKEGDTPTWFYFLPSDLSDPDHPEWGGWGGRYEKNGNIYSPAADYTSEGTFGRNTVNRWREEYQNDFAARMDWTTSSSFSQANHNPVAVINQPNQIRVQSGQNIDINASGSWDPDGDALTYEWFQYREAGTYANAVSLTGANSSRVQFQAPTVSSTKTIHIIFKLRDNGGPNLFDYQRVVVTVDPATTTASTPVTPTPSTPTPTSSGPATAVVDLRFNEGSGTLTTDSSQNGNSGELLNIEGSDWVTGVDGKAIRLDATNEHVRVRSSTSWAKSLESFSVSAWVRFDSTSNLNYNSVISVGNWQDQRINIYPVDGTLQFSAASDGWSTGVKSPNLPFLWNTDNTFHHIVAVKDASDHSASLYVDGKLVGQDEYSSGSVDLSGWDLAFCANSASDKQLACSLDNAKFYHGALTSNEITQLYEGGATNATPSTTPKVTIPTVSTPTVSASAAVVDLAFNEGYGTTSQDRSGLGNNADLLNVEAVDWIGGLDGKAIRLDSGNERARVRQNSSWGKRTDTYTVSAWVRIDDTANSNYASIISVGNWQDQRLNVYPLNGQLVFTSKTSAQPVYATSPWQSFLWQPDGRYHHIVAVKSPTTAELYLDGNLVGRDEYAAGVADLQDWDLSFCADSMGQKSIACSLDSASLFHKSMTASEVLSLYQSGGQTGGQTYSQQPPAVSTGPYVPSGAVLDLRFDENSGTSSQDKSGKGNNARLLNTDNSSWVTSGQTKGVKLDGVYEQARVTRADSWSGQQQDLTMSMWVRFDDLSNLNYRMVATVGNWSDQRLALYPVDGRLRFAAGTTGGQDVLVKSKEIPFLKQADGQFHNIVLVKDSSAGSASIYVDGFLLGRSDASGFLDLRGWDLALGGDSGGQNMLPMTLASTQIHHRVLTNREISDLFLRGSH